MSKPQLAAPGAGLPFPENLIARLLLAVKRSTGSPQSFTAKFVAERQLIRALISEKSDAALSTRVLIARPKGLEDSSRYWSVWMTLTSSHRSSRLHWHLGIACQRTSPRGRGQHGSRKTK